MGTNSDAERGMGVSPMSESARGNFNRESREAARIRIGLEHGLWDMQLGTRNSVDWPTKHTKHTKRGGW
jgi:hypothetical protein